VATEETVEGVHQRSRLRRGRTPAAPSPVGGRPQVAPDLFVAIRSQSMPAASASTCRSRSRSLSSPARARGHCGGRTEGRRPLQLVMFTDVSRNLCDSVYTGGNPVAVFGARRHLEGLRAGWTRIRAGECDAYGIGEVCSRPVCWHWLHRSWSGRWRLSWVRTRQSRRRPQKRAAERCRPAACVAAIGVPRTTG
jgi:hypothetical protein